MAEPFIGEIKIFAGDFAPRGWAMCAGQLLPIASNQALFAILGTTYGGDGRVNFALPDLRGRAPVHWGQGPGLPAVTLGERAGAESVTLLGSQLPLPDPIWRRLNIAWIGYCAFMAIVNGYVAAYFSTEAWVSFKLWGYVFPLVFLVGQGIYITPHLKADEPTQP